MSNRAQFRRIEKLGIYYGSGAWDRLIQYDAVVLEPGHRSKEEIQAMRDRGTMVLAYVSVMEVHDEHPLRTFLSEDMYMRKETPPYDFIVQASYQNRLVGLDLPNWRGLLLRHIGQLLTREGYDGVFLDTVGDVEMDVISNQLQQIEGATLLVEQIRRVFPDTIIVQNNGLELLCDYTAPFVDGITWENPPIHLPESKQWVKVIAEKLNYLRVQYPFRIFILFEGEHQDSRSDFLRGRAFAQEYGFTPYFSPIHYQSFH